MLIKKENYQSELLDAYNFLLVEFFGTWCTPCKMQSGILDKIEEQYKDSLKLVRLDLDAHEDLAKLHSVMTVPTMILYKDGQEVERMAGFRQLKQITEMIEKFK